MLYSSFTFRCLMKSPTILPMYKGSTFRGVFGRALKNVVCALKRNRCEDCLLKSQCMYIRIFEPSLYSGKNSGVPNPFVIQPPDSDKTGYKPGDAFEFNLLVFGEMVKSLPYFIYAFDEMGKTGIGKKIDGHRGKFDLKDVKFRDRIIYSGDNGKLEIPDADDLIIKPEDLEDSQKCSKINVSMKTPLRVKFENKIQAGLPFHVLVRAMLRRISLLENAYGRGEPDIDYKGLVNLAQEVTIDKNNLKWFDWQRYSFRQDEKMFMGGMVGSITYKGDLGKYIPLMKFCEKVHLGKQTTFGLGKIRTKSN